MQKIVLISVLMFVFSSISQTGGEHVFTFLDLGFNARANALGTDFISVQDNDVNLAVTNPSLLHSGMSNTAGFNHAFLAGGVSYGMFAYAKDIKEIGTFSGHLRYVSYGKMKRTDQFGVEQGEFSPGDFALGFGYGKSLNPKVTVGSNFNLIYSQLDAWNAFGVSLDLAGSIKLGEDDRTLLTALVKNVGVQITGYTKGNREPIRADAQLAISHKLSHAPIRFSLTAHDLNRWDLTYFDPSVKPTLDPLTNEEIPVKTPGVGEKIARHFTYQMEILLGEKLHLRAAFDYHKRQIFKITDKAKASGISFGAGLYFKRFSLDYGFAIFSQAGYNNMFTLTTNFSKWKK